MAFKKAFPCIRNPENNKKYNTETAFSVKRMRVSILLAVMLTIKAYFFKICNNKYDNVSVDLILRCHLLSLKQLVSVLNVNIINLKTFNLRLRIFCKHFYLYPMQNIRSNLKTYSLTYLQVNKSERNIKYLIFHICSHIPLLLYSSYQYSINVTCTFFIKEPIDIFKVICPLVLFIC